MGKKTFKDNPAMQFITPPEEEADAQEETPEELQEEKPKAKRPTAAPKAAGGINPPEGYRMNPIFVETKSKRVQLVLQPSLYERAKEKAWREHLSVNEYIHQLIEKDTGSGEH